MSKNTITVAPEVLASETFRPLVERASVWLAEEVPFSDEPTQAEWTWVDNRPGEELVALTMRDAYSSPTGLLRKDQLEDRSETVHKFNQIISRLLRARTDKLLEKIRQWEVTTSTED